MSSIAFLSGIHGVGKGYLGKKISESMNVSIYTASDLIRQYGQQALDGKIVPNINRNQDLLISAIHEIIPSNEDFILDGHLCLISKNNEISRIPKTTYESLGLKIMIVLMDNPKEIANRLFKRDNKVYDEAFLESFQAEEVRYAKELCNELNIELLVCEMDVTEIENFITKHFLGDK
ncbi:MAG: AAA family ATPase [Hungatella sp.]|nr:AAA family ATPase [Hungatella sp.]